MTDLKDMHLDETNFRVFAKGAIKKYGDSNKLLDCLLWGRIISLFEFENAGLKKYKIFYDHIKSHFEKEHPDWKVECKICGKTYDEIIESGSKCPKSWDKTLNPVEEKASYKGIL